jgi:hypothetical protein
LSGEAVTQGHPAQTFFRNRAAHVRTAVASAIAAATGRTELDAAVQDAASAVIAATDGLRAQWLLEGSAVNVQATLDLVVTSICERLSHDVSASPVPQR